MSFIQIKTSIANSAPTTLELGEQGYSYVSNTLFIGTANGDGVLAVGGKAYIDRLNSSYAQANTGTTLAQAAFNAANNVGQVNGQPHPTNQRRSFTHAPRRTGMGAGRSGHPRLFV